MKEWWKDPIRAVTLEFPGASDITTLNVREMVRYLADLNVNVINAFAISYWPGGAAFYQSSIAQKHPELGDKDFLADVVDEGHKHGIKVVAYVNTLWGSKEMYEKHPDWAQRRVDGNPTAKDFNLTSVAMCPHTPYRDYILQVVEEISSNYNVDGFYFDEPCLRGGWCNCESCQKMFKKTFGEELPLEAAWGDPLWQKFVKWRYNEITKFKKDLYEASKKEGRAIFFQHPFPLAFWPRSMIVMLKKLLEEQPEYAKMGFPKEFANWYIPMIYGADLEATAKLEDVLHFELYRKGVQQPLWWYGVVIRLAQSVGNSKPIIVLNMQGYSPFDLYSLPEAELRLHIGEIVANHGNPLFAYYYPDIADKRGWDVVGQVFSDLKRCTEYFSDIQSVKYAAVLHSSSTTNRFDSEIRDRRHVNCLMGICKALLQNHILFDLINEEQLKKRIKDYKVLLLPNVGCMTEEIRKIIKGFVENGGGIVASYQSSLFSAAGDRFTNLGLADVFGVDYTGKEKIVHGTDSYMCIKRTHPVTQDLSRFKSMYIPSIGTQLILKESRKALATLMEESIVHYAPLGKDTQIPTIVVNTFGKGRSVYFPGAIGDMYLNFSVPEHAKLVSNAVRWAAGVESPIRVSNCPPTLELTAYREEQGDRTVIHLVNSIRNEVNEPITYVSSEREIKVMMNVEDEKAEYNVFTIPEKEYLSVKIWRRKLCFTVPEFRYHVAVVVEKK